MSRIDELISSYCPDGVKFRQLADIARTVPGLTGKTKSDFSDGNARFASYRNIFAHPSLDLGAQDFVKVIPGERQNSVEFGDILITGSSESLAEVGMSSVVTTQPSEPIYLNSFCFIVRPNQRDLLVPDFAKHLFRSELIREQIRRTASGVTRINISKSRFMKISIPVPPLEMQREIVRILDQFTQLEAELEAELEARRRQYEHYRDGLLSFDDSVAKIAIGEVIEDLRTGLNPRQNFKLNAPGATNFYITVRELADFTVRPTQKTDRVDDAGLARIQARSHLQAGDVLFSGTGTIGRTALVVEEPSDWNIKEGVYALTPKKDIIRPRFLIHLLRSGSTRARILASADGSTVASVSMASLRRVLLPVPSLEVQDRCVSLLDSFETLTNDLSIGLPAELAARRKQYEYYRDKLLAFKEAV